MIKKENKKQLSKKKIFDTKNNNIENIFNSLDDLINKMENDDCSFSDSVEYYKVGINYLETARKLLDKTKKEIEVISD